MAIDPTRPVANHGWQEMRGGLARLVFPGRHLAIGSLGVAAFVLPGLENRAQLAAVVWGVLLPMDVAFGVWTRRHGRFPVLLPVFIQVIAALATLYVPEVFPAAMVALLADNTLTAIALGRRTTVTIGLAGVAVIGLAAWAAGVDQPIPILAAVAIETVTCSLILGRLLDQELRLRQRYGTLTDEVDVVVWEMVPGTGQFSYVSPRAESLLGYPLERWYEKDFWTTHLHPDDAERTIAECDAAMSSATDHVLEYRMVAADGREVHLRDVGNVEADASGRPVNARGVMMDITDLRRAESRLREQATHDALTGLPNRSRFADRLDHALRVGARTGSEVALLYLDLDDFKQVNDALGHEAGDQLLRAFGQRLQRELRDCDTVARLGGDEFAVLLTVAGDEAGALSVARRILGCLDEPFLLGELALHARSSIGVAVYPDHATDAATLAARADIAMYAAKQSGRGVAVYEPALDRSSVQRLTLLADLRRAIAGDELFLEHQPCFDLAGGEVVGFEALVRWRHPERGLIPPADFIELAEVSGLIEPLSRWVVARAIEDHQRAGLDLRVSVNLSARNLAEPDLVDWLDALLRRTGFPPCRLVVELTESEALTDLAAGTNALARIRDLGVTVSVDDFGTGQSSLAYLRELPVDELKIDRAFVAGCGSHPEDAAICRTIVELAHQLRLEVVAEGVDDDLDVAALREIGCDRGQGFHLSHPVGAADLRAAAALRLASGQQALPLTSG